MLFPFLTLSEKSLTATRLFRGADATRLTNATQHFPESPTYASRNTLMFGLANA
jgi:hypothetical protein